jgi:putative PIN family toxin of toxin-antitoxin system
VIRVVLDTNVLVSGVLRPLSVPARVLTLIHEGQIRPVVDPRILEEYVAVLCRPRLNIPMPVATELLRRFADVAEHVTITAEVVSRVDRLALPDPDDRPFMEVALSAGASAIVTGNTSHFPAGALEPVRVLTPRQLVDEVRAQG